MAIIARIESFVIPYSERNDHDSTRWSVHVRVEDSDGVVGWGEAATILEPAARATAALLDTLTPTLLGIEADPVALQSAFAAQTWWYGDAGIARFALSALDIATWDARLFAAGHSLADAVIPAGADERTEIPALLSLHATRHDLNAAAEEIAAWITERETIGAKVAYGKRGDAALGVDRERDVRFMHLLRMAAGPDARIMIDVAATLHWSLTDAIERIRGFEEAEVAWTEEPLGADDPAGYRALRAAVSSPIAYGEREWSPSGYERIAGSGSLDVAGVDPGRVGGITDVLRITRILESHGVQGNAHAFAGPILLAAAVPLSLASPAFRQLETPPHRNTLHDLVDVAPAPTGGVFRASGRPGLGVVIDETAVRHAAR